MLCPDTYVSPGITGSKGLPSTATHDSIPHIHFFLLPTTSWENVIDFLVLSANPHLAISDAKRFTWSLRPAGVWAKTTMSSAKARCESTAPSGVSKPILSLIPLRHQSMQALNKIGLRGSPWRICPGSHSRSLRFAPHQTWASWWYQYIASGCTVSRLGKPSLCAAARRDWWDTESNAFAT